MWQDDSIWRIITIGGNFRGLIEGYITKEMKKTTKILRKDSQSPTEIQILPHMNVSQTIHFCPDSKLEMSRKKWLWSDSV
jgi:hypothetical protein